MRKYSNTQRNQKRGMLISALLVLALLSAGCRGTKTPVANNHSVRNEQTSKTTKNSIEDFEVFYHKFHTDSVFQMSRIKFPLEGKMIDGQDQIEWTKENWVIMKTKIYDIDSIRYKTSHKKTETSFYQKFWLENSGLSAEYRFELIGKKWYLVYALDQNM